MWGPIVRAQSHFAIPIPGYPDVLSLVGPARMDGVREGFPRATYAVLYVIIQN